jgi:23S rRNA (uridine2552-2'-O)-methyltransferase
MAGTYNRKDSLYNRAKEQGFRSRAYFKLEELNRKYKLLKPGSRVLDLGAWPGGWLQYTEKTVGPNGVCVGIDLVEIEAFSSNYIKVLAGDVGDPGVLREALVLAGGKFDVVLSDMSPKLSGIREADNAAVLGLAELALASASDCLTAGGGLVIKVFKGGDTEAFVRRLKPLFGRLAREELDSSRKTSNEFYVVGLGYRPA